MTMVETHEAKSHLTQFLLRVAGGERILITCRGQAVAMLAPPEPEAHGDIGSVVREMLAARDDHGPNLGKDVTVRRMREEGRRFGSMEPRRGGRR